MRYPVIVVGAGPAGGITAYELARRGVKVLIVERARLPRYKACGGGLPRKTLELVPFDLRPACDLEYTGARFRLRGVDPVEETRTSPGMAAMRSVLDEFIVRKAREAGAELRDGVSVKGVESDGRGCTVRAEGETYKAEFVVGADGVNSRVARAVGLRRDREVGVAVEAEVYVKPEVLERCGAMAVFDFCAAPDGYGWIFPKKDHLSAGVYSARPKVPHFHRLLDKFLQCHEEVREYKSISVRGHLIPLGGTYQRLHTDRVLLVGDAAGLADPFLGEGIYYAIRSGMIAAKVLGRFLAGTETTLATHTYTAHCEITRDLLLMRAIGRAFFAAPDIMYTLLLKNPVLRRYCADLVTGALTPGAFILKIATHAPQWAGVELLTRVRRMIRGDSRA